MPEHLVVVTHQNRGYGLRAPFPLVRLEYDLEQVAQVYVDTLLCLRRGDPVPTPLPRLGHTLLVDRHGDATAPAATAVPDAIAQN